MIIFRITAIIDRLHVTRARSPDMKSAPLITESMSLITERKQVKQ
jgi:hypothetical protein